MGEKGSRTRDNIKQKAYPLFAERGFQAVTMKDICEATGLSRGGLYRHYESTRQIFEEILDDLAKQDEDFICQGMEQGRPATEILKKELSKMEKELEDALSSLSYAIYEYSAQCDDHILLELNKKAVEKWNNFLEYGIRRGEFKAVNTEQMVNLILYTYQGIRLWSRVIPLEKETIHSIMRKIEEDLTGGTIWRSGC